MPEELKPEEDTEVEDEFVDDDDLLNFPETDEGDNKGEEKDVDAITLAKINEATGKDFKSMEDFQKSTKELEKAVADKGRESTTSKSVLETLYVKANPDYAVVKEEVEKEAKESGKDPIELYENSTYFKNEAKARIAEKKETNENKKKITAPTGVEGSEKSESEMETFMSEGLEL